ncbi:hypothetical protein HB364_13500 [Pseudoflavitalea sp. X16]|uniref:hypothetical protein n=1 Tax=Paraflavitalea devenefica TaxID=2716334 RepID=UPI00141F93E4|nr:hypothetical protein [Paraflavitalea devenefica]NII26104.1 hypothetical protein [Paraflavitalea devenefica]
MGTNNIIVREYLESLAEKNELDYIFPLLLSLKGFKIIRTPKETQGLQQFGKDVIAVGKDGDGVTKRFYFELKGESDQDITSESIYKKDGINDSLLEMSYVPFKDSAIPGFNTLPSKCILVHNGVIRANALPVFDGIVDRIFPNGGFERWDIHRLTTEFSDHLFNEYLLTDAENIKLFKRTLVLLNAPDYDLQDWSMLLDRLLGNNADIKKRAFSKMFATLNLLGYIIHHYSAEEHNLEPARKGVHMLVLKTWAWVLKHGLEKKPAVQKVFNHLLDTQYRVLNDYFRRTLPVARLIDGIFSEKGGPYENVGYSLRSMDYLGNLVYFFLLRHHLPAGGGRISPLDKKRLEKVQKKLMFEVIDANIGCRRPLLDRHSRPILLVALFILQCEEVTKADKIKLHNYLADIFNNIILLKAMRGFFPEFTDNLGALIEHMATNERPDEYIDSSSMLIMILFELLTLFDTDSFYKSALSEIGELPDLQTAYPHAPGQDIELLFFSGVIHDHMAVESRIKLPEKLSDFKAFILSRPTFPVTFRTDLAGYPFLKWLPVLYYHNDIFPQFWRQYIQP